MAKSFVSEFVVRNGASVDMAATVEKFSSALQEFLANEELVNGKVAEYVHAVFDKFPGCRFNTDSLISFTLKEMEATPDQYPAMSEAIKGYVSANKGDKESGAMFRVQRGKGGGVCRWADVTDDSEE